MTPVSCRNSMELQEIFVFAAVGKAGIFPSPFNFQVPLSMFLQLKVVFLRQR